MANSSLVPKIHVSSAYAASDAVSFQRIAGNAREAGDSSISKEIEPDGGIFVREQKIANNLSNEATEIIMASWRPGTLKQYNVYVKKFKEFCKKHRLDSSKVSCYDGIEFLTDLFKQGLGYSAINTARSALSAIIDVSDKQTFGEDRLVKRFMKGVFESRPALPKYTDVWDISRVLTYLDSQGITTQLNLKTLTLRLVMLLCILTGQRCQTIHAIELGGISFGDTCRIVIPSLLKQSRSGHHLKPMEFKPYSHNDKLCVVENMKQYIKVTKNIRKKEEKLFISYQKPHKAVSKSTVSRWCKQIMSDAGINVKRFGPHSIRAASTSSARNKGVPLATIMTAAGWSNAATFKKFYSKNVEETLNYSEMMLT